MEGDIALLHHHGAQRRAGNIEHAHGPPNVSSRAVTCPGRKVCGGGGGAWDGRSPQF
eukprot:SAG11_NODE_1964_length_3990_cov_2.228733_1_plen_56_part_10